MDKFTETDIEKAMKNLNAQMKVKVKNVGSKNKSLDDAVAGQKIIKKVLSKKKALTPKVIDKAAALAKAREEGGRFSVSDIEAAMQSLLKKEKPDFTQKNKGGLQEGLKNLKARGLKNGSKDVVKKKKKKKKFPDLNKDGKVTFKDILIGRGVVKANKGTMVQARGCKIGKKKKTKIL